MLRRTPLKRTAMRTRRRTEPMPAGTREALWNRCAGHCELCGSRIPWDWAVHHRLPRSAGGTWALSNLLCLDPWCHNLHERSVHQNPRRSYDSGHLVRRGSDPAKVPVLIGGALVLLTDDGRKVAA